MTNQSLQEDAKSLQAPPPILLWLALMALFWIIVGTAGAVSFLSDGQRLGSLIPFIIVLIAGSMLGVFLGTIAFRHHLPRYTWLLTLIGLIVIGAGGIVGGALFYRDILPPRYQTQLNDELPFLRVLLPPTPAGGIVPTVEGRSSIDPDDLLALPPLDLPTQPALVVATELASPTPNSTPTSAPTDQPSPTSLPPTAEPTVAAVVPIVQAPTAGPFTTPLSLPTAARMYGFTHVQQTWNNCGPANVTMVLSHFGWRENQAYAARLLKPDPEDKNVSPQEIVDFINEQTGVRAMVRIGGSVNLLKALIAANVPIIIERGYSPEGYDWIGHYQTVVGYDDSQRGFYIYDSFLGSGVAGQGLVERYDRFDEGWQAFNRVFIVVYEAGREGEVMRILGDHADDQRAAEIALETARDEARANPQNGFAWFNMGSSYVALGRYEEAAAAYDRATQHNLPFRMLWYQFGPFEAYYQRRRYDDVLALVNNNLNTAGQDVEESYYWQGRVFAATGRQQEAASSFRRALARNPRFAAAQQALKALG